VVAVSDPRLVVVEWIDSNGGGGWDSIDAYTKAAENQELRCESAGWLIADTDRYLLVAGTRTVGRGDSEQVNDPIQIPRVAVTRIRSLSPGRALRH
jgi:hypothetical protein